MEDRISLEKGRGRENPLPILKDFATNRKQREVGPEDEITKNLFRTIAARDPLEVVKNCKHVQNLRSSRPTEQRIPRAQRSGHRERMLLLGRMTRVVEDFSDKAKSCDSDAGTEEEPLVGVKSFDPHPDVVRNRVTVTAMRTLLRRAEDQGTLSLRRLALEGELEDLLIGAASDAITESLGEPRAADHGYLPPDHR